jgi:endonuclease-3
MTATKKNDKFQALLKALQKRYKHSPKTVERKLLDCLMFAACLENASYEAAEAAFSVLEHHYIDWNELRVSTPQEIADTLPMLPNPLDAGERIKKTLQWVFETTYMFDLEDYRKKTIGQTIEYLDSIPSCTPFMINYLVQAGLGGHLIPFDEAAMRILRRLDLTRVQEGKEDVPSAERFITKSNGAEFAGLLHLMGVEFFERQNAPELLEILKAIDSESEHRSWTEPPGVLKKADVKIVPKTTAPAVKGFKPSVEMDDEESDTVELSAEEESASFIDHKLLVLGTTSKVKGKKNNLPSKKGESKKTKSEKKQRQPNFRRNQQKNLKKQRKKLIFPHLIKTLSLSNQTKKKHPMSRTQKIFKTRIRQRTPLPL